jgi:hypothetical protein
MCGDGKHWRKLLYAMAKAVGPDVCRSVLFCTKRQPKVYMRVSGGKLCGLEYSYDFEMRKSEAIWFIRVSWDDTKEGQD